jgi:hypothetical protein
VFNITFSNISVISWWSVLLVEETRLPKETTDLSQVTDKLHILCCIQHTSPSARFKLTTLVAICTDCTGKCNYYTIMTSPKSRFVFFKGLNITTPSTLTAERRIHFEENISNFINIGLNSGIFLYKVVKIKFLPVFREF